MLQGKTESGFEFELDEDVLDDYELLELLQEVDNGEYGKITQVVDLLLGSKQKGRLKEHVRNENGRVTTSGLMKEVEWIFKNVGQLKN